MKTIKPVSAPRYYVSARERKFASFDTETCLIEDHLPIPPLVCLQARIEGQRYLVGYRDAIPFWREMLHYSRKYSVTLTAHHAAYDTSALLLNDPACLDALFDCYDLGLIEDSLLCEKLSDIARGEYDQKKKCRWKQVHGRERSAYYYGLDDCVFVRCGIVVAKGEDTYRKRYGELREIPVDLWPAIARQYALDDADYHWLLRTKQEHDEEADPVVPGAYVFADAPAQARAGFALQLARAWGICTEPAQTARMIDQLRERQSKILDDLIALGFVRPKKWRPKKKEWSEPSRDTKKIKDYITRACEFHNLPVELTEGDNVAMDAETLGNIGAPNAQGVFVPDPNLAKILEFGKTQKLLGYTGILSTGFEHPIHSEPNTLIANGRISWGSDSPDGAGDDARSVNLTNLPREPGVRECYIPHFIRRNAYGIREFLFYFFSVDYSQLELCTVAQVQLWELGHSTLADLINAGEDLHNRLSIMFLSLQGIHVTPEEFERLRGTEESILYDLSAEKVRDASKRANFGFWGGMGIDRFMSTNRDLKLPRSSVEILKDAWRSAYPEERDYFADAERIENGSGTFIQYTSGRIRGGLGYSDAANTKFSGLAADGAKDALYRITRAAYAEPDSPAYGSRINAFVHDEFFGEVPAARAHEATYEIARLARETMQARTPDVQIKTSMALSLRWRKGAKTYHDETGRLQPFEYSQKFRDLVAKGKSVPEYA